MRFSFNRHSTELTVAWLSPSCCAIRTPVRRLPPQLLDLHDPLLRHAPWRPMRTRTAILEPGHALLPVPPDPLGCTLLAELELGLGLLQARRPSKTLFASSTQLPSSRSNGQQPIETSHLDTRMVSLRLRLVRLVFHSRSPH
jgi:hypothetical protein